MLRFIRIDEKNNFLGKAHVSFVGGDADRPEAGISCYQLDSDHNDRLAYGRAVDRLRSYWKNVCSMYRPADFKGWQITVFAGRHTGRYGLDEEDLAECEETLFEWDAEPFMTAVLAAYDEALTGGDPDYLETVSRYVAKRIDPK